MKDKYKTDKGLSFLLAFGGYGGFYAHYSNSSFRICLGWIGITIFFYDVEGSIGRILKERKTEADI